MSAATDNQIGSAFIGTATCGAPTTGLVPSLIGWSFGTGVVESIACGVVEARRLPRHLGIVAMGSALNAGQLQRGC